MGLVRNAGWVVINALQFAWFAGFTLFGFLVALFISLITANLNTGLDIARYWYGPINIRLGFSSLVVEGAENFPRDRPYLFMLNHQSMIDIMVAWMLCPSALRFIAKRVLLYVPVIGWTMWVWGFVAIDRGNARAAINALKKAADALAKGRTLCAFPEGTRTKDGTVGPFKKGLFILALKAGVPIVPCAIEGCQVLVPRTGWRPRPAVVRAKIGAPFETAGYKGSRDVLMDNVRNCIIDMHLSIGGKGGVRGAREGDSDKTGVASPPADRPAPELALQSAG